MNQNEREEKVSLREAKRRIYKKRFGKQWVVCRYHPDIEMIHESYPMDYAKACWVVRDERDWLTGRDGRNV